MLRHLARWQCIKMGTTLIKPLVLLGNMDWHGVQYCLMLTKQTTVSLCPGRLSSHGKAKTMSSQELSPAMVHGSGHLAYQHYQDPGQIRHGVMHSHGHAHTDCIPAKAGEVAII